MSKVSTIHVRVEQDLRRKIAVLARAEDRTVSSWVRTVIVEALERRKRAPKREVADAG